MVDSGSSLTGPTGRPPGGWERWSDDRISEGEKSAPPPEDSGVAPAARPSGRLSRLAGRPEFPENLGCFSSEQQGEGNVKLDTIGSAMEFFRAWCSIFEGDEGKGGSNVGLISVSLEAATESNRVVIKMAGRKKERVEELMFGRGGTEQNPKPGSYLWAARNVPDPKKMDQKTFEVKMKNYNKDLMGRESGIERTKTLFDSRIQTAQSLSSQEGDMVNSVLNGETVVFDSAEQVMGVIEHIISLYNGVCVSVKKI